MATDFDNLKRQAVSLARQAGETILRFCRWAWRNFLLLTVDLGMRSAVAAYDRSTANSSPRRARQHEKESQTERQRFLALQRKAEALEAEAEKLRDQLADRDNQLAVAAYEKSQHQTAIEESRRRSEELHSRLAKAHAESDTFRSQLDAARSDAVRAMDLLEALRSETTAKLRQKDEETAALLAAPRVLYADADALGQTLRKPSPRRNPSSLFRLTTLPGTPGQAEFETDPQGPVAAAIANRATYLASCEIAEIAANPTRILTEVPGLATLQDNKWQVTRRARIRLL